MDEFSAARKRQILTGGTNAANYVLARKQPIQGGHVLSGMIRRKTTRVADHRREVRYPPPLGSSGEFRIGSTEGRILDISRHGLQAELPLEAEIGSDLSVTFYNCEAISARVVWARHNRVGFSLPPNAIELSEIG